MTVPNPGTVDPEAVARTARPVVPDDILRHIIRLVPRDALPPLRATSKRLRAIVDQRLCRHLVLTQSDYEGIWRPQGTDVRLWTFNRNRVGVNIWSGDAAGSKEAQHDLWEALTLYLPLVVLGLAQLANVAYFHRVVSSTYRRKGFDHIAVIDNALAGFYIIVRNLRGNLEANARLDQYDPRFALSRVLDIQQTRYIMNVDSMEGSLAHVRLIRQRDTESDHRTFFPIMRPLGGFNFAVHSVLELFQSTATYVRFMDLQAGLNSTAMDAGRVGRLVLNVLFDPESVPKYDTSEFTPPILGPEFECDWIYVMLTPHPAAAGSLSASQSAQDYQPQDGLLRLLALYLPKLWFSLPPNRRFVFVGAETWRDEWLGTTPAVRLVNTAAGLRTAVLSLSETEAAATLVGRFKQWLWESTNSYLGPAHADDVRKAIHFITLDEFRKVIANDELFPFIMSPNATF